MKVECYHASVYGNGAKVAEELKNNLISRGIAVSVHHIDEVDASHLPPADLYVFSSPGRIGKPIKGMRRFIERLNLPAGTRYALLTTEAPPKPNRHGNMPTEEETCRWQRVRPVMNELLQAKGLVKVAEDKVYVTETKGPLEEGWQAKVDGLADQIVHLKYGGVRP